VRHLHFTQSLEPLYGGGLGTSTVALHREMLAMGLSSMVCATYGEKPQAPAPRVHEFRRIKPDALYLALGLRAKAGGFVAAADVIHGHGFYVGTNYFFGSQARRQGKPLVYHAHGFFEPWILNRSRSKKRLVHWLFEDDNFRAVRFWRALTSKEAEQIRALGMRAPIVVIPNGLNLEDYAMTSSKDAPVETPWLGPLEKESRRVLFLGRIHPKKGLKLLLAAWGKLKAEREGWELVIAGPDEQGHLAVVLEQVRSLGLENEVRFTGPVTGSAKVALLHSADLFVLTSYSEGFSISLLEAMASGVAVVATRACNFPQITSSAAGWECDATSESVSRVLSAALLSDPIELRQRGESGRHLVETDYSWSAIVNLLQEVCVTHCSR
jgi:glycosyltransferase involved in cell wall biosynthesis